MFTNGTSSKNPLQFSPIALGNLRRNQPKYIALIMLGSPCCQGGQKSITTATPPHHIDLWSILQIKNKFANGTQANQAFSVFVFFAILQMPQWKMNNDALDITKMLVRYAI